MNNRRGMFIVFEGVDCSGTTTQIGHMFEYIRKLSKYNEILCMREPSWRAADIRKKLEEDLDAYSNAEQMAGGFILDRMEVSKIIDFNVQRGIFALCDRHSPSTCVYQSTQGLDLKKLLKEHKDNKIILRPDRTYFLDISVETSKARALKRGEHLEKFEKDPGFINKLVDNYRNLLLDKSVEAIFGSIVRIEGEKTIEEVASEIQKDFLPLYKEWESKHQNA